MSDVWRRLDGIVYESFRKYYLTKVWDCHIGSGMRVVKQHDEKDDKITYEVEYLNASGYCHHDGSEASVRDWIMEISAKRSDIEGCERIMFQQILDEMNKSVSKLETILGGYNGTQEI